MSWTFDDLVTVTFTLFAIIDIIGSIPLLISIKEKSGGLNELKITLIAGLLMTLFLFLGEQLLRIFGLDIGSFAVGGSIVIFILGLEMVLGVAFFKPDQGSGKSAGLYSVVLLSEILQKTRGCLHFCGSLLNIKNNNIRRSGILQG